MADIAAVAGGLAVAGGAAALLLASSSSEPPAFVVSGMAAITTEPGCEEYPVFTPDGNEIVFDGLADGDTEILAITLDGKRRRLTHSPGWDLGAAVSPDGKHVAYVHFGDAGREPRRRHCG